MKETRMPPAQSANLVANSGNTIYGVSVIDQSDITCVTKDDPFQWCIYVSPGISPWWCHMETSNLINIGSCDGLLPDGTKPLREIKSTNHH